MSKFSICVASTLGITLLAGCVSAPSLKQAPPVPPSASGSFVSDLPPNGAQKYAYTNLEGTYFGVSGASGSLAVGLLLGPIGVAANVAYINLKNRERANPLTALTSQNLSIILRQELSMLDNGSNGAPATYKLTPAANVLFTSDTVYGLTCTLTAELQQVNGASSWSARYAIPVDGAFNSSSSNDAAKASNALRPCLRSAYELFEQHIGGKLGLFQTQTITSRATNGSGTVDQKLQVAVSKLPGRVLVNDFSGVAELRAADVIQVK